jgi:NDP-sugar pyrophosphorylase family protein
MNLFGFQRSFLDLLNQECIKFFEDYAQDETREFFLPSVVMEMIVEKKGEIYALPTSSEWFGMTYPEDRAQAKETIKKILSA